MLPDEPTKLLARKGMLSRRYFLFVTLLTIFVVVETVVNPRPQERVFSLCDALDANDERDDDDALTMRRGVEDSGHQPPGKRRRTDSHSPSNHRHNTRTPIHHNQHPYQHQQHYQQQQTHQPQSQSPQNHPAQLHNPQQLTPWLPYQQHFDMSSSHASGGGVDDQGGVGDSYGANDILNRSETGNRLNAPRSLNEILFSDSAHATSPPQHPDSRPPAQSAWAPAASFQAPQPPYDARPSVRGETYAGASGGEAFGYADVASTATTSTTVQRLVHGQDMTEGQGDSGRGGGNLHLGAITPVRAALDTFEAHGAVMTALANFLISDGPSIPVAGLSPAAAHAANYHGGVHASVFAFVGFPLARHPDVAILTALTKFDLDALAWALAARRNGGKADVGAAIVKYLRMPLTWATPMVRKTEVCGGSVPINYRPRGGVQDYRPSTANAPGNGALYANVTHALNAAPDAPGELPDGGSMYDFAPAARNRGNRGLATGPQNNLNSALRAVHNAANAATGRGGGRGGGRGVDRGGRGGARGLPAAPSDKHSRSIENAKRAMTHFPFAVGENPFHVPNGGPLGTDDMKFSVFHSDHLNTGREPELLFPTPPSRRKVDGVDFQVHLRCVFVEQGQPARNWKQSWPFPSISKVNGNSVELNQAQRYTSGKLAGTDMATNLSPFLRKYKSYHSPAAVGETNHIQICRHASTASSAEGFFVCFAQEIRVLPNAVVRRDVFARSKSYWDKLRELYRSRLLRNDSGGDILDIAEWNKLSDFVVAKDEVVKSMTSGEVVLSSAMRVSLRCPLMLSRMKTPVKGEACTHIQCFDLDNFLVYTRRSCKFVCPVCNRRTCLPKDLITSPFMQKVLDDFQSDDVDVASDGTVTAVVVHRTGISSDDDDDDGDSGGRGGGRGNGKPRAEFNKRAAANSGFVDLTLSDDDDDGAPAPSHSKTVGNDLSNVYFDLGVRRDAPSLIGRRAAAFSAGIQSDGVIALDSD